MHQLLEFVTSHTMSTCPVCRLSIALCNCDDQITDRVLTLIALEGFNTPTNNRDTVITDLECTVSDRTTQENHLRKCEYCRRLNKVVTAYSFFVHSLASSKACSL